MALKLMYITNRPDVAQLAESAGVDRVFVDMEYIGKADRQGGMNTVQYHHTSEDVSRIKKVLTSAQLLVRCNPIHEKTTTHGNSAEEIESVIAAGADIIMLPYFKTAGEVRRFIELVNGRAIVNLLLETPEAVESVDEILSIPGIDEIHIGLNDLSLGYGKRFMFELLADGTVERLCKKCADYGISYGFGGIAALGKGALPAEHVIMEHYRLGSGCAILARSFCDTSKVQSVAQIQDYFCTGVRAIREYEEHCCNSMENFEANRREMIRLVQRVVDSF